MRIKNFILSTTAAVSILGASMAFATDLAPQVSPQPQHHANGQCHQSHQQYHATSKILTEKDRAVLHTMMQEMRESMRPLLKEKEALRLQLVGKLATPGTEWKDLSPLIAKINDNNAKITTLFTKTQLSSFQKLGVLLFPHPHAKHSHHHPHRGYC